MKIHSEDAYHLLYRLGAAANYTGFSYLVRALQLCAEEPERLLLVTKWLYPDVAKQYGTNWKAVERDIQYRGPCDLEFKPAAFGDSGPPGTLPKAVYGATARNPACQPVAVRF